jgi:hypothetical protein
VSVNTLERACASSVKASQLSIAFPEFEAVSERTTTRLN